MLPKPLLSLVAVAFLLLAPMSATALPSDEYVRGYAAALVQREFQINPGAVDVRDGVVFIRADLGDAELERIRNVLMTLDGVRDVVREEGETRRKGWTWIPGRSSFRPLVADPRWPRFAAAYQYYIDDHMLGNVGAVSFGENLPLVRYNPSYGGSWEVGIQGGIFSIFDFDRSFDLINTDYIGGLPLVYALGNFQGMVRVFHQSSHLGDEYLLRGDPVTRINLSYEAVHTILSYDFPLDLRAYVGGSYIFRIEPSYIDPWRAQGGIEWIGPSLKSGTAVRPIAAIDLQFDQESGWDPEIAPVVGLQFEGWNRYGSNFQLLIYYFNGQSPNGQFYRRDIQYIGFGGQFHF